MESKTIDQLRAEWEAARADHYSAYEEHKKASAEMYRRHRAEADEIRAPWKAAQEAMEVAELALGAALAEAEGLRPGDLVETDRAWQRGRRYRVTEIRPRTYSGTEALFQQVTKAGAPWPRRDATWMNTQSLTVLERPE